MKLFYKYKSLKLSCISMVLLGGFVIGIYGLLSVYWGYESKSWPTTEGVIIDSRIAGSTRIIGRRAFIKYEYFVEGKKYVSPMVSYTWKCIDYQGSIDVLLEYPQDTKVMVYFDPDDPKNAVLKTEISGRITWMFLVSILAILIGLKGMHWKMKNNSDAE